MPVKNTKTNKHPGGQPTKYKPEYCQQLIKFRQDGQIIEQIAQTWDVNVDTIYEWRKVHKEFSEAFSRGKQAYAAWFYEKTKTNLVTDKNLKVNDKLYKMLLAWQLNMSDNANDNPKDVGDLGSTIDEQLYNAKKILREKKITVKEYESLMSAILKEAEILEKVQVVKDLDKLKEVAGIQ